MKKYLLFSTLITSVLYLLVSFVKWNPYWISGLATWDQFDRTFFLLFFVVIKEMFTIMIWNTTDIKKYFDFIK